jgi:PadR family transcriptional regulator, regulatory protein PadR
VFLYLDRLEVVVRDRDFAAQALSVLAVLCARPQTWRHGYDIARETGLKSGTLYPILIRLADRGWLETSWEDEQPAGCPRRHRYRLTGYHPPGDGHWATCGGRGHPVLASDREREQTLQTISRAVGEGRLSLGEAERRIEAVLHSRHRHELAILVGDLPPQAALSEPGPLGGSSAARLGLVALAAMTILAAALVQAVAGLWELWPAAVAGCGLWAAAVDADRRSSSG